MDFTIFGISSRLSLLLTFYCFLFVSRSYTNDASESFSCASLLLTDGDASSSSSSSVQNVFEIKDGFHLNDDYSSSISSVLPQWNRTKAVRVKTGCTLTLCSKIIMGEKAEEQCQLINQDSMNVPLEWYNNHLEFNRIHCGCVKECKCEDVILTRHECGRAYLDTDCNSCSTFYTNFKQSQNREFNSLEDSSSSLSSRINSIIVRSGCTLKIQLANGTRTSISGEILQEWTQELSKYQCKCDPNFVMPTKIDSRAADYPLLVQVPKTSGAINIMLKSPTMENHPGLTAALQSLANKRSTQNAYILLLGLTGSGKSSTINFLFGNSTITEIGHSDSTTTNIHEYRIQIPIPELGLSNTQLRIIDTPGIIDTRGLAQDAKYLATLDHYLATHEDLKGKLPNVILVFTKFDDNRFSGYGSNFVKMLRTIELFKNRLIDSKYSNIIFVASHYLSASNDIVRRPGARLSALKQVVEEFSLLPSPILFSLAENKPELYGLLSFNGYYVLPNGEFYPKNLFDKIQLITTGCGDPIGEAIIRTAFKELEQFDPQITEVITPALAANDARVLKYLAILSSFDRNPASTQISVKLEAVNKNLPSELAGNDDEVSKILGNLQRILYLNNMLHFSDLPSSQSEIFSLFKKLPKNPATLHLLQHGLNLTLPSLFDSSSSSALVGYSYDVKQDTSLGASPLDLSNDNLPQKLIPTEIGFLIPNLFSCELRRRINTIFNSFNSIQQYIQYRLNHAISSNPSIIFPAESFSGSIKPGLNLILNDNMTQLSALIEFQNFQLSLKPELIELSDEFTRAVEGLTELNQTDWDSVSSWKNLFNKYGTHVMSSCYGGGNLEIIVKKSSLLVSNNNDNDNNNLLSITEVLTSQISIILNYIANLMIGKETALNIETGVEYELHYSGGASKYFVHNFSSHDARFKLRNWKESLDSSPILLQHSQIELIPLSQLVRAKLNDSHGAKLEFATSALFNSSLIYKPIRPKNYIPLNRQQIQSSGKKSSGGTDYLILKEFATMFQTMSTASRTNNEKLMNMMLEARKEAAATSAKEEELRTLQRNQARQLTNELFAKNHEAYLQAKAADQLFAQQRMEREEREMLARREQDRNERLEFLRASEVAAKRTQDFMTFIIDNDRKVAEAMARQTSIWDKVLDFGVKVGTAVIGAIAGGSAVG